MYHVWLFGKGGAQCRPARLLGFMGPKSRNEKGNRVTSRDAACCFGTSVEEPSYDNASQRSCLHQFAKLFLGGEDKDKGHFLKIIYYRSYLFDA